MPFALWRALAPAVLVVAAASAPAQTAADSLGTFELPTLQRVLDYQPRLPLRVLTADGVEIAQFGTERRMFVPLAQVPRRLQDAVVAIEDIRFREHNGLDTRGIARAAWATLSSPITGGMKQGGSTITQQVTRMLLLTHEFSAERKIKEMILARRVDAAVGKDRVLEIYLNEIVLGPRIHGFGAAAQHYFGKTLPALTLAETAMLAGLPQNPYYANPATNFERATTRQRIVLARLLEVGQITKAAHDSARNEKIALRPGGANAPDRVNAGHVAEMARLAVTELLGDAALTRGIQVRTSLRAGDQRAAQAALRQALLAHDRRGPWRGPEAEERLPDGDGPAVDRAAAAALRDHRDDDLLRVALVLRAGPREVLAVLPGGERVKVVGDGLQWVQAALARSAKPALRRGAVVRLQRDSRGWVFSQWPQTQGALVALDPASGRVRALVGSFDFGRSPFNHATQAWRQPGSAIKPLLISAALEKGVMPSTLIDDAPFSAADGWSPKNSDGRFDGALSLREALARSRNTTTVRLLQQLGLGEARAALARFGLDAGRQSANLTLALGSGSATPMQMATAYGVLASGGHKVDPVLIERISDAKGQVLFQAPPAAPPGEAQRVLSERNAFVMTSLLQQVTKTGTAARAQAALGRPDIGGKTGTTDDAVDAWFAGYHASVVAVVWIGHSEPRSLGQGESGGGLALPAWIDYMRFALAGVGVAEPATPAGLVWQGDDWLYDEWAGGGWIRHLGVDGLVRAGAPAAPASAASEPESDTPQPRP
ncbi:MAG: penicillin-binding protein 1A [Aquabacterium sp.]